ncbi:LacI family DNA-binding transcriptional regulator [Rubrolithibacter danxiaensis]|uniref:LacI family DNA-binding transcriptional regulator n=1 Tax=Rubrolithibacter danxiaensis TaxID=3390805 RepID=UPI003BF77F01
MKKVTIHDIARELNITFSTVARALNDNPAISEATKKAVKETAKRLNYRQNKLASSLRSGRSNIIGIIVPSLDVSFFSSVVHGIEKIINQYGYSVLLYQSNESFNQETKGIETFLQSRVDGILASVSIETTDYEYYEEIKKRKVPLLLFDRDLKELNVPAVTVDDYRGGFIATEHLIKKGYTRIVHLGSNQNLSIFKERERGYADALKFHNIPVNEDLIIKGKLSVEFGREAIHQLILPGQSFDAVFAQEDFTGLGAMQQLKESGIKVPEEIGVIGFANEAFGAYVSPALSTIDQQTIRMGEEVALLFMRMLKDENPEPVIPEKKVLDPILIERESTNRIAIK